MNPIAAPAIAMAGVSTYLALYHFSLAIRRRDSRRKDAYFALTATFIALYDLFCVGLYDSTSVAEGASWQRYQFSSLCMGALFLVHFVDAYLDDPLPKPLVRFSWIFPASAALCLVERNGWIISDVPSIKHGHLPFIGDIVYYEAEPGPWMVLINVIVPYLAIVLGLASWKMWRAGADSRRHVGFFFVGFGVFLLGATNDSLVSMGVMHGIYVIEYAWTGMVVFVGHALSSEVVDAAIARQALAESRERLAHVERLESVGQLAGGIAHDLNNMLTPVLSYAQLAQRKMSPESPEYGYLEHVIAAAERASLLTRQLLAFGRKQVLEVRPTDLRASLTELEPLLRRLLPEAIELRVTFAEGLPTIDADVAQLEQVFMNLVANARDAMPNGGALAIHVAPTTIPGSERGLVVTVRDEGEGMDRATRERIFEPFFTTKPRGKGTGLGLSTVHGIVRQHGGRITVESAPSQGTTFRIFFPSSLRAGAAPSRISEPSPDPRGTEHVLVVDDDRAVRTLVRDVLVEQGYRVETAGSAAELHEVLERSSGPFDILLTDVVLPDTDGTQIRDTVAARDANVVVLFMSGHAENILGERGVLSEHVELLRKPFTAAQLATKVRTVLDRRRRAKA